MEEQDDLLGGWKLKQGTLSFSAHDTILTVQAATPSDPPSTTPIPGRTRPAPIAA